MRSSGRIPKNIIEIALRSANGASYPFTYSHFGDSNGASATAFLSLITRYSATIVDSSRRTATQTRLVSSRWPTCAAIDAGKRRTTMRYRCHAVQRDSSLSRNRIFSILDYIPAGARQRTPTSLERLPEAVHLRWHKMQRKCMA